MLYNVIAVYTRELRVLRHRLYKQLLSMSVNPLLYALTFGWGIGRDMSFEGVSYISYLIPGLVAMTSMNQAYSIGADINISRFYWRTFEEIQSAPVSPYGYVTGEILYGATKVLISAVIILIIGAMFGVILNLTPVFWAAIFLNSLAFSSIAVSVALRVSGHADQTTITNFIITPIAFLSGTFFPLEKMPLLARYVLMTLPLPHATKIVRAEALSLHAQETWRLIVLVVFCVAAFAFAVRSVEKAKE